MRRQQGVALVLVLAVTGVLALLILQVSLTARQQVAQAQRLVDRAEAGLRLQSREAALLYSMLTRERNAAPAMVAGDNPYAAAWNFRGEPFLIDEALIRLQDMSGLMPMPTPGASALGFAALLVGVGIEQARAEQAARALESALVTPSRSPLQSMAELGPIAGLSTDEIARLEAFATLYPISAINPGTAAEQVLAVKYRGSTLESLLALRRDHTLDDRRFEAITGETLDDIVTTFLIGPGFRVDVSVEVRGVRLRRQSIWTVRPASESNPLELWSYRNLDHMASAGQESPR